MIETEEEEACMEQALKSVSVDEEHKLCRFRVLYKFPILSLKKRGSRGIKKKTEEYVWCGNKILWDFAIIFIVLCVCCVNRCFGSQGSSHQSKIQTSPQSNPLSLFHQFISPKCVSPSFSPPQKSALFTFSIELSQCLTCLSWCYTIWHRQTHHLTRAHEEKFKLVKWENKKMCQ